MKKLFIPIIALCLIANIACGKNENNSKGQKQPPTKQEQETAKASQLQEQEIAKAFQFGSYKVGEKFENQDYETKEYGKVKLEQKSIFEYSSEPLNISTTSDGTIAGISKNYKDYLYYDEKDNKTKDLVKIIEQKSGYTFREKNKEYYLTSGNIVVTITEIKKLTHMFGYDYVDHIPVLKIENKNLIKQRKKEIEEYNKKIEEERIKQAADNFEI